MHRITAACHSLVHLDLARSVIVCPEISSPLPLSTVPLGRPRMLRYLDLNIHGNPGVYHFLAILLSSTVKELYLDVWPGPTGTILTEALLPLLLQHAPHLEFLKLDLNVPEDPIERQISHGDPFLLHQLIPLLTKCKFLSLPAYTIYPTNHAAEWEVDPAHLPSLTTLVLTDLGKELRGLEMWSSLVEARGGVSLVEVRATFAPTGDIPWEDFDDLCERKGVRFRELSDFFYP